MLSSKTFELLTLVSLLNKHNYLHVTEDKVNELVVFVHGPLLGAETVESVKDRVIDYLAERYPRLVEVAAMLVNSPDITQHRYGKMIDLYRRDHPIEQMPEVAVA